MDEPDETDAKETWNAAMNIWVFIELPIIWSRYFLIEGFSANDAFGWSMLAIPIALVLAAVLVSMAEHSNDKPDDGQASKT